MTREETIRSRGREVMVFIDDYIIREEENAIIIHRLQKWKTQTNRKAHLTAEELGMLLQIVKTMYEGEKE